jgi:hypothetical protein
MVSAARTDFAMLICLLFRVVSGRRTGINS